MSNLRSNSKAKTNTLDAIAKSKKNMNYIKKFELPLSFGQYINFQLIFNNVYIDKSIIASNIKFNLYVFYYFESY